MKHPKKSAFTAKTCFAELDVVACNFRKSVSGFRIELYAVMAQAQRIIFRLNANKKLRRDFIRSVLKKRKNNGKARRDGESAFNLTTEVMAIATGAKSRSARKVAWKRGRVLDYLRESGVKPWKTAPAIRMRGGIEKILKKAVEEDNPQKTDVIQSALLNSTRSRETAAPIASPVKSNNQEVIVPVWMRLSDRDQILESLVGSRIRLSALRIGQKQADMKITGIKVRTCNDS
jgi:hypothetical protein